MNLSKPLVKKQRTKGEPPLLPRVTGKPEKLR